MSVLLFLILMPAFSLRADVQSAIATAKKRALKNERAEALLGLRQELAKAQNEKDKQSILKAAGSIGSIFFTELGQKDFEMAESYLYSLNPSARSLYAQAREREPHNFLVVSGTVREFLSKKECAKAREALSPTLEVWSDWVEFKWLKYLILRCEAQPRNAESVTPPQEPMEYAIYIKYNKIYEAIEAQRFSEASKKATLSIKQKSDLPDTHYLLWLAEEKDPAADLSPLESYIKQCKALTAADRRKHKLEPELCSKIAEAEAIFAERGRRE